MRCPKCESDKNMVTKSGPHNKLICSECFTFIKFLSARDYKNYAAIQEQRNIVLGPDSFAQIADEMMRRGITKEDVLNGNSENWTNALVDSLECLYGIETRVRKAVVNS